jgi:Ca2+-binding EF-hand superfamily protein
VHSLYETFYALSNGGKNALEKETFKKGLGMLEKCGLKNLDDSPFVDRHFTLLDTNGDGSVDLHEFLTGLSMLCKGSVEDKLKRKRLYFWYHYEPM